MRAVRTLRQKLEPWLQDVHSKRLAAVFDVVTALVSGNHLSCTALGRSLPGPVKAKHNIKKVDRLLGNEHLLGTSRRVLIITSAGSSVVNGQAATS